MKGTIIEINDNYIVVLTNEMSYIKLKIKSGNKVGQKIYYTKNDYIQKKKNYLYGCVASLLILFAFLYIQLNSLNIDKSVAAVVSIDINPSVEFELDDQLRVISVVGYNDEAKGIIDEKMLLGKYVTIALSDIMTLSYENKYLEKDDAILLSAIILQNEKISQKLLNSRLVELAEESLESNTTFIITEAEELKKARGEKISVGKYQLYNSNKDFSLDYIRNNKVTTLYKKGIFDSEGYQVITAKKEIPSNEYFLIIDGAELVTANVLEEIGIKIEYSVKMEMVRISKNEKDIEIPFKSKLSYINGVPYFSIKDILDPLDISYGYEGSHFVLDDRIRLTYINSGKSIKQDEIEIIGENLDEVLYIVNGVEYFSINILEKIGFRYDDDLYYDGLKYDENPIILNGEEVYDAKRLLEFYNFKFGYFSSGFYIRTDKTYILENHILTN